MLDLLEVRLLAVDYKSKIDIRSDQALNYPMHLAAQTANLAIADILVSRDAHLNCRNAKYNTPIHTAASLNKPSFLSHFRNYERCHFKDTLSAKNFLQLTPLMCAAYNGHLECVRELFAPGTMSLNDLLSLENTDCDDRNVFHLCACQNQLECFNFLMDHFPRDKDMVLFSRDKEENTVLHVAAKFGHLDFVQDVLDKVRAAGGGSMLKHLVLIKNSDEQTLLHLACLSQASDEASKQFIKYILDKFDSHLFLLVLL